MKIHLFSVLSVAGIVLMTGSVFGSGLQWKTPAVGTSVAASVDPIPTVITTDDAFPSEISQAQHSEPLRNFPPVPQTMPAQRQMTTAPAEPFVAPVLPALPGGVPARTGERVPCSDQIVFKNIREISHDIRLTPDIRQGRELPQECLIESQPFYGRHFGQTCFMWKASRLSTRMAYFEDVRLERHGLTKVKPIFQPIVSGVRFFGTIPLLPYKMCVTPPNECVYTLGHIRSGSCPP